MGNTRNERYKMNAFKEKAYAKINLYLDVVSKREDGFHEIKTVMHTVSLSDNVTVAVRPSRKLSIELSVDGAVFLPNDSKNLAYRAAELFFERLGATASVRIKLVKRIPISAGLAGGSSDAAAVLRALNRLYKRPFTQKALMNIGAELGSDVPYCIVGKTALCEGRGEKITKLSCEPSLNVVVARADERVSTPIAYADLDLKYDDFKSYDSTKNEEMLAALVSSLNSGEITEGGFFNVFESVVFDKCPKAKELKSVMLTLGADVSMMSGSGPSVFGVFKTEEEAKHTKNKLVELGYLAYSAKSV